MQHPSSKRVLIVEDDPDALEVLRSWAETQRCEVRTAASAESALEVVGSFEPDLVVTDYSLRDVLNGVDLIVQLRARGARARCVLVTGLLHKALLESVSRINGVPILAKPFDLSRLGDLLAKTRGVRDGSGPGGAGGSGGVRSGS